MSNIIDKSEDYLITHSYDLAVRIVEKLLQNMAPERCTWGERYYRAYQDLKHFRADMVEDVKGEIEREMNNA